MKRIPMIMSFACMLAMMWLFSAMPSAYAQDIWVGRDAVIHDCDVYLDTDRSSWYNEEIRGYKVYIGELKWVADGWTEKKDSVMFTYVRDINGSGKYEGGHYRYSMKSSKEHGSVENAPDYIKNTFELLRNNRKKIKETQEPRGNHK